MEALFSDPEVTFVFMLLSIPIVTVIAKYWHESIKIKSNNRLKQNMLDRGMSAQEIEQVLNAGTEKTIVNDDPDS